ncbi:MAG TPA: hypothetical protein DCE44_06505 [Verrucomicrobiales bacterium]|nr:hypothetical protein [Verrucomicrobiales bacterium]
MKIVPQPGSLVLTCIVVTAPTLTQGSATEPVSEATVIAAIPTEEADEKAWSYSISAYSYFVPDDQDYVQPTVAADRGWLHLEARYNYEALKTGSTWIGYNFSVGDKLTLDFTPMLGGVFGDVMGVAPGYEFTVGWWKLELSSEGEYVFDTGESSESFFYTWSELTLAPVDWFRVGLVVQRTKAFETDFDIQRGFLVRFTHTPVDLSAYVFNPDNQPTFVFAVSVNF